MDDINCLSGSQSTNYLLSLCIWHVYYSNSILEFRILLVF